MDRAARQLEGIAVPLEDPFAVFAVRKQRILSPLIAEADVIPADFFLAVGFNLGAKGARDELRTEADAEDRDTALHRIVDQAHLGNEVRMIRHVVDAHRPPEDDEPVVAIEAGLRIRMAAEVDVTDADAGSFQQRVQGAQDLERNVLANKDLGHDQCARPAPTNDTNRRQQSPDDSREIVAKVAASVVARARAQVKPGLFRP